MKKLVVCMAAAVLGLSVSAATVDWQYKITNAQGTEGYNNGYTVYLVDAAAWNAATISADTFTDSSVVLDSTTFGAASGRNVGQKTYTTVISGTTTGSRAVDISSLAEGASKNVYYVILNTNADPDSYTTIADTLTGRSATGEETLGSHTSMTAAAASSATWTAVGGSSGGGGSGGGTEGGAPEPTSGLLLLVGGAMLALRRKQK